MNKFEMSLLLGVVVVSLFFVVSPSDKKLDHDVYDEKGGYEAAINPALDMNDNEDQATVNKQVLSDDIEGVEEVATLSIDQSLVVREEEVLLCCDPTPDEVVDKKPRYIKFDEVYDGYAKDTSGIDSDLINHGKIFSSQMSIFHTLSLGDAVVVDINGAQIKGRIDKRKKSTITGSTFSMVNFDGVGEYMTASSRAGKTKGLIYTRDGSYMYEHNGEVGFIISIYEYRKLNDALYGD